MESDSAMDSDSDAEKRGSGIMLYMYFFDAKINYNHWDWGTLTYMQKFREDTHLDSLSMWCLQQWIKGHLMMTHPTPWRERAKGEKGEMREREKQIKHDTLKYFLSVWSKTKSLDDCCRQQQQWGRGGEEGTEGGSTNIALFTRESIGDWQMTMVQSMNSNGSEIGIPSLDFRALQMVTCK